MLKQLQDVSFPWRGFRDEGGEKKGIRRKRALTLARQHTWVEVIKGNARFQPLTDMTDASKQTQTQTHTSVDVLKDQHNCNPDCTCDVSSLAFQVEKLVSVL